MEKVIFEPIGILRSVKRYRYETPRQAVLAEGSKAVIKLNPGNNFEQALKDLDGFDRIWVVYLFHLNKNWKPMVMPPYHSEKKIGVFATRAPYRPNPIGLSCVRLIKIKGLSLYIAENDILDGSPVLDIKPYLPYSDSFPESKTGWVELPGKVKFEINIETLAFEQIAWLERNGGFSLTDFIKLQLETDPDNNSRKRIYKSEEISSESNYTLAYRTWRVDYKIIDEEKIIEVLRIRSGYTPQELARPEEDRYKDKALHLSFNSTFIP